jgi:hypothetical protein
MALYLAGIMKVVVSKFEKFVSKICSVIAERYSKRLTVQFPAGLRVFCAWSKGDEPFEGFKVAERFSK